MSGAPFTAPLVPTPVYGLRTWAVDDEERLAGPHQGMAWPLGGAWFEATCAQAPEHRAPAPGCGCGIHAWHPSRRSARRVLAVRWEVPGVVEARGSIELHADGFRAERAQPHALVLLPGRNAALVRRLAEAHHAQVVEVASADALAAWCRERGIGLNPAVVAGLLGPAGAEARRRRVRAVALRLAAAVAASALLVLGGLRLATDPPGDRVLHGRTGEVRVGGR